MMYVDIAGAVRAAKLFAEFNWTWTMSDIPKLCSLAGWLISDADEGGAIIATDLDVRRPEAIAFEAQQSFAYWGRPEQEVQGISVRVGDRPAAEAPNDLLTRQHYTSLHTELSTALGGLDEGRAGTNPPFTIWHGRNVIIELAMAPGLIKLDATNPTYRWMVDQESDSAD
ncbi:DUF6301 family protein [Nocardia sp. NPDC058666]|uniref:DUF6301 family protein n=1 Tax=unclassified Nocardia TaxID=2637762 RepID=UPI0036498A25